MMNTAFEALQKAAIFTKLNLHSVYNLIHIRQEDEWKKAFITLSGHYEYRVMPFGVMNAPAIFQGPCLMCSPVTAGKPPVSEIGEIGVPCAQGLLFGIYCLQGNTGLDLAKIRAVRDWPHPSSLKAVQQFPGFAIFIGRFLRQLGTVAAPFTMLTHKTPGCFCWTAEAQAFEELMWRLITAPVLQLPDPKAPFIAEVDASN
ncbi:hypothetical protein NFI96_033542 [Prochilodus magdalenae]|nr:hypothetical protein NFI96_033542 [Prochilodus magdalenae]